MKEPVTHIERPRLPWRTDEHLTECRLDARSYPTWTFEQARAKARDLGKTRFYMIACVTCIQTSERHPRWEVDPVGAMAREVAGAWARAEQFDQIRSELQAIALLIEAHRDEFDQILTSLSETVNLADQRIRRSRIRNYGPDS